ncbi:unnamed protein product [Pelagomonas calceolata]|uniref:Plastid lipid-associated protein/fibrillin conserved domain-containing protein n=2 Tax=Pelagomonas calceolata TaxID=35677 RepID=A0A8J2S6T6_9STRA|nr:unnamed protein product [Pelagomonas calceolata]
MRTHALTLSTALCSLCSTAAVRTSHAPTACGERQASRRHWLHTAAFGAGLGTAVPARALDALPATVRKYTALAPLGSATATLGGAKRICLSEVLPECLPLLAKTLARDIEKGATGKGGYPISGDLTPEIFRDDCRFVDPTNDVTSLAKYRKALTILFDPNESSVTLVKGPIIDEAKRTISATVRSVGTLQLPWRPKIEPWESYLVWKIDGDGLIEQQSQTWNVTATSALKQTFSIR